jgi:hypothetical protein
MLDLLSQIRALRVEPPLTRPTGVTDVKLLRMIVRASAGRTGITIQR